MIWQTINETVLTNEIKLDESKVCHIGNDVWIGSNVTIMSGVTIGDGAVIANNSHVVKNIDPYSIVGGNPAKFIKFRFTHLNLLLISAKEEKTINTFK